MPYSTMMGYINRLINGRETLTVLIENKTIFANLTNISFYDS